MPGCVEILLGWFCCGTCLHSAKFSPLPNAPPMPASCIKESRSTGSAMRSVRFGAGVKAHDSLAPLNQMFSNLVVHCLDIGGMANVQEFVTFMTAEAVKLDVDYRVYFDDIERLAVDLQARIQEIMLPGSTMDGVFILPGGGGTNTRIYDGALANINHLVIVLGHVRQSGMGALSPRE